MGWALRCLGKKGRFTAYAPTTMQGMGVAAASAVRVGLRRMGNTTISVVLLYAPVGRQSGGTFLHEVVLVRY